MGVKCHNFMKTNFKVKILYNKIENYRKNTGNPRFDSRAENFSVSKIAFKKANGLISALDILILNWIFGFWIVTV